MEGGAEDVEGASDCGIRLGSMENIGASTGGGSIVSDGSETKLEGTVCCERVELLIVA